MRFANFAILACVQYGEQRVLAIDGPVYEYAEPEEYKFDSSFKDESGQDILY